MTPPTNLVVTAGQSATFTVQAAGPETLTYQWRRNGIPISGATSPSFTLANTRRTDADYYDVVVSAGTTSATSPTVRLSVAPTSYPTTIAPDPKWNLQLELSGYASGSAIVPLGDGRSYIAGTFSSINGVRRTSIGRINTDGSLDLTFVPPEIDRTVTALAVQSDGKVLIAGDFLRVNGMLRPHLARLNFDGSLDATFMPATEIDTFVSALAVQNDGRILVGGVFNQYPGTPRHCLVRLNGDGSLDPGFLTKGLTDAVNALVLQSDGKILVGGLFTRYLDINGVATSRERLARLNSDGTLDPTFNVASAPDAPVYTMALQSDGKIIVGGRFSACGATRAGNIARFNPDGSLDLPFTFASGSGFNAEVDSLFVQPDGRILVGGNFSNYAGAPVSWLVRLNVDATRDTTFLTGGIGGTVHSIISLADGRLLVGGFLTNLSGGFGSYNMSAFFRLSANGVLDPSFNSSFRIPSTGTTFLPLAEGKVLVTGKFDVVQGQLSAFGLARLNSDATVDPSFNLGRIGVGPNGLPSVSDAVVQPDGKLLITGTFKAYNGAAINGIARLNTDGGLDGSFNPGLGISDGSTIALLPGGRIFVAGSFTSAGGVARGRVAVFAANGALDVAFGAGAGANSSVNTSVVQPDGKIVIGGDFTTYDGIPASRIARLNPDGTLDRTFATGAGCNSSISTLALQLDGKLVLGGAFSTFDGVDRSGVARLNSDGTLDTTFVPPVLRIVNGLVVQEDSKVIVRGSFTSIAGFKGTVYLARLDSNGSLDATFMTGGVLPPGIFSSPLVMRDDGQLAMQTRGSTGFCVTQNAIAPVLVSPPSSQTVVAGSTATFAVVASSALPLTYQWLFSGAPVAGAVQASLSLTNVQFAQAGSYQVVVSNELGSVTSAAATLTVVKGTAPITLGNLSQIYDGTPHPIIVSTVPTGLPVAVTYDGSTTLPTQAGSYAVAAVVTDPSYEGSAVGTLTIAKATATVSVDAQTVVYNGIQRSATATTSPAGLYLTFTYNGGAVPPTNAGSYTVNATVDDPNYTGTASGTFTIAPAAATIMLSSLAATYDGTPKSAQAVTSPSGLNVALTYNGSAAVPANAGSYSVAASILDPNYTGAAVGTLAIAKAAATVTLDGLNARYDGAPKPVTVTTAPSGVATEVTYNGSTTPPIYPGAYTVVATIVDGNYTGSPVSDTLAVGVTALVRHAPVLDGGLDGSLQVLLTENLTLNSPSWISGDLLMPGAPLPVINGQPIFTGTIEGIGSAIPSNYQVTLNQGVTLRYLVRRVDPIALPTIAVPPTPTGTRDVTATSSRSVGSFATLRNLTLVAPAGLVVIPPGTYGIFAAQRSSGFILGSTGATTPSIYNLQGLSLSDVSQLVILGPVIINVANGLSIQVPSSIGSDADPEWLILNVASGNVTLRGTLFLNGFIVAPASAVAVQGGATLIGGVISDRLTIDSTSFLGQPAP